MAKDRSGGFHPAKGKPSGADKQEGLGISTAPPEQIQEYLERTNQYVQDDTTLDPSVKVRHPNRNVSKNDGTFKGKANLHESDTTIKMAVDDTVETVPEELTGHPDRALFAELAEYRSEICATIYLPTHQSGVAVNEKQDAILFKNALKELTAMLKEQETENARIERLLTPGYELLQDDQFWARMRNGLAVFISEGYFKYIKMPIVPDYELSTESRFYMTPLVPVIASKEYFYLLVLSKQQCKLFRADAFGMEPVEVPGLPNGVTAVKKLPDNDAFTYSEGTGSRAGGPDLPGAAGGNPEIKDNITVYFEAVDDVLFREIFNKENAPLLLAGGENMIPIYKAACHYHNVYKDTLTGSHEHDERHALYNQAKEIMAPIFQEPLDKALTIFANQSATELTSSIIADIIPAAFYGRISHLFAEKGQHIWGEFDENTSELKLHDQQGENSRDLLDLAVIKALTQGGEVYLLDRKQMPAPSQLAAVFRY
jgi:hypothetical protein